MKNSFYFDFIITGDYSYRPNTIFFAFRISEIFPLKCFCCFVQIEIFLGIYGVYYTKTIFSRCISQFTYTFMAMLSISEINW